MSLRVVNIIPQFRSAETNFDSEPSIAVNPANLRQIVVSAFTPDTAAPMVTRGVYFFSNDGGTNWNLNAIIPGGTALLGTGDISVRFGGTTGVLYAGILRGDTAGTLNILRTANFAGMAVMEILVSRANDDQPWVETATVGGADRVYVSSNDVSQRPNGATASVDLSLDAATAMAPAGFTTTARLETRPTAALPGMAGNQDGPSVRVAIHSSGVLYAAYFGWRTFATTANTSDIVVVRDDNWASGTAPFQALTDPDTRAGMIVDTGRRIAPLGTLLGTQRVGSSLSIAVDPRDSQRIYIAWCDGLATAASPYTLHVRRSDNGGANWTGDLLTISNATNPGLAVNSRGTVALLYQQFATVASAGRWRTHFVQSVDRFSSTFSDVTLADVIDSSTGATITVIIGDYANLVAIGKDFYGVFSAQNAPVAANFPVGVTYLRNADFGTGTLLAVDNVTAVSVSVDPFFFHEHAEQLAGNVSALAVARLPDLRLELWANDGIGNLFSTWKWATNPDADWVPLMSFLGEVGPLPAAVTALAVAPLPDGRLELWASTADGGLFSCWKTTTDPNATWTGWADFAADAGALPAAVTALAVAPLPDGRLELWASTADGGMFSCWKTTTDPNATWTGWADFIAEV
jgi:hypothetical protein